MIWLGILIGIIIGIGTVLFVNILIFFKDKESSYLRRGLIRGDYVITDPLSTFGVHTTTTDKINVQFEVGELESTDTRSKVVVISLVTDNSLYNQSEIEKKKLSSMIDMSWVKSSDIEWITSSSDSRNKKIDEILK